MPGALLSLALVWTGEAPPADAPHVAAAADDSGCLSIQTDSRGQVTSFSNSDRSTGACARTVTKLPLVRDTTLGTGNLFNSDLELSDLDFGALTAQEVKLKFGVSRGFIAGINATIDGSFGRVLGTLSPIFDEQLRVGLNRPLDAHWETGLEGHVSALGSIGLTQLTERTGLIFLCARAIRFSRGASGMSSISCSNSPPIAGKPSAWEPGGVPAPICATSIAATSTSCRSASTPVPPTATQASFPCRRSASTCARRGRSS
jgi:hypothetical protein